MTSPARKPVPNPPAVKASPASRLVRASKLVKQALAMLIEEGATPEQGTYVLLRAVALVRADAVGMAGAAESLTALAVEFAEGVRP